MKNKILMIILLLLVSILILNTQSIIIINAERVNPVNSKINKDKDLNTYLITTLAWNKNKLGITIDVSGYRVYFNHKEFKNGTDYIDFYDIQFADKASTEEELEWYHISDLDRLEIYVPINFDLYNVTEKLNELPHDTLESYYVYTTLIDVLAFDSHKNVFHNELFGTNKTSYNTTKMKSTMPDWLPIIYDINAFVSETYYTYIAGMDNQNADQIFFYKNDDTLINQTMQLKQFPFPMVVEGNTRFFGHIKVNNENVITQGTLTEYYLSKIKLFKILPIYSFIRREQIMELIN